MELLGKILRITCLSLLFGGSVGVVISVMILINAAVAHGVSTTDAATTNAPVFILYSRVNLFAGVLLLIGEAIDYASRRVWNRATIFQYASSLLCVVSTMAFALGIVPNMERLLPVIHTDKAAHEMFTTLHHVSRIVFGTTIFLALTALLLPLFGAMKATPASEPEA